MNNDLKTTVLEQLSEFYTTPFASLIRQRQSLSAQQLVIELFHHTVANVPAYADFLQQRGIDANAITDFSKFAQLPLTTKNNYMNHYPLLQRCRGGDLTHSEMWAVSSGSTGTPTLWPRNLQDELRITARFEQVFCAFEAQQKSTLAVVCFALGTWVGGMYTADCCRLLAQKGFNISVITPGNNKTEILRVVDELGDAYEQVVLFGYPPFIKDVVDTGINQGIQWQNHHVKMVFAGEVFSEQWRNLVNERVGNESGNITNCSASLYGTADGGVLGNETPLSIAIRRYLAENPDKAKQIFAESRLPTLVQYDPIDRFFEVHDNTLVISGDNGVPLLRYHIADKGGIISFKQMQKLAGQWQLDIDWHHCDELPFVYIFGRADFTVSYFGANIYPENISVGLEQSPISDWVTGKFVLQVVDTEDHNQVLSVIVEMLPGIQIDEIKPTAIAESIKQQLLRLNSEFAHYTPAKWQTPAVHCRTHADPQYFPLGVKHRYTKKI